MPQALDARDIASGLGWLLLASAAAAGGEARADGGGAAYPRAPAVQSVSCLAREAEPCGGDGVLISGTTTARVSGLRLDATRRVVFEGRRGTRDDAATRPTHAGARHLEVRVPQGARSGPVTVIDDLGREASAPDPVRIEEPSPIDAAPGSAYFFDGKRRPSIAYTSDSTGEVQVQVVREVDGATVTSFAATVEPGANTLTWNGKVGSRAAPDGRYLLRAGVPGAASVEAGPGFALLGHLFPIRGRHNLGYTRTNRFGGGRGHQGIDMFARCGTPLAAARGGRVEYAGYHARAGNYAVIDGAGTGRDYVYMHMNERPLVRTGQRVFTGQRLGEVGDSGNASGCHLHFELWSAPGWYKGGKAIDPMPALRRWDGYS